MVSPLAKVVFPLPVLYLFCDAKEAKFVLFHLVYDLCKSSGLEQSSYIPASNFDGSFLVLGDPLSG